MIWLLASRIARITRGDEGSIGAAKAARGATLPSATRFWTAAVDAGASRLASFRKIGARRRGPG